MPVRPGMRRSRMAASKVPFSSALTRGLAVGADGDLVAQPRQLRAHELLQRLFVVDEQDAQAVMSGVANEVLPCRTVSS